MSSGHMLVVYKFTFVYAQKFLQSYQGHTINDLDIQRPPVVLSSLNVSNIMWHLE